MPRKSVKGYSFLKRPFQMVLDLAIIFSVINFFIDVIPHQYFYLFIALAWLFSMFIIGFYAVYRFTSLISIFILLTKQAIGLSIALFAFYGFVGIRLLNISQSIFLIAVIISIVGFFKYGGYYALKQYRKRLGGNKRRIIVFGNFTQSKELIGFFNSKTDIGYYIQEVF